MSTTRPRQMIDIAAAMLCGAVLLAGGCSPAASTPSGKDASASDLKPGSGGAVAVSSGGTLGSGGTPATGNTGGTPGTSSGGANATGGTDTGTGGAGGAAGAGDIGTGGATGSGGVGGMGFLISCGVSQAEAAGVVLAGSPVISDFTYTDGTTDVRSDGFSFGNFYDSPSGYGFHYPSQAPAGAGGAAGDGAGGTAGAAAANGGRGGSAGRSGGGGRGGSAGTSGAGGATLGARGLAENMTGSDWHITGVIGDYSAFALAMSCITDASAYAGIEFTIRGNAGTPSRLTLSASFSGDDPGSRVTPSLGMCEGTCTAPSTVVNVTPTKTLVQIPWSRFVGGRPMATLNPAQLTGFRWIFAWSGAGIPYPVDVTVDDLHFMTAPMTPADAGSTD